VSEKMEGKFLVSSIEECGDGFVIVVTHSGGKFRLKAEGASPADIEREVERFLLRLELKDLTEKLSDSGRSERKTDAATSPPAAAEFLLGLLCKKSIRDGVVGDFEEIFRDNCDRYGRRRAVALYWADVTRSIWPLVRRGAVRAIQLGVAYAVGRNLGS
jgi:hypothetical protein